MRALVVVPMQTFSYVPLPSASSEILRTPGCRVEQERAAQVHRRLDALVEDPDLGAVADADDVALHRDLVARPELQDLARVGDRERDLMRRHQNSLSKSVVPSAPM
jgi:hypothetical protein